MSPSKSRLRTVALTTAVVAMLTLAVVGRHGLALFLALPVLVVWVAPRITAVDDGNRDAGQSSEDGPSVAPDAGGMLG